MAARFVLRMRQPWRCTLSNFGSVDSLTAVRVRACVCLPLGARARVCACLLRLRCRSIVSLAQASLIWLCRWSLRFRIYRCLLSSERQTKSNRILRCVLLGRCMS